MVDIVADIVKGQPDLVRNKSNTMVSERMANIMENAQGLYVDKYLLISVLLIRSIFTKAGEQGLA